MALSASALVGAVTVKAVKATGSLAGVLTLSSPALVEVPTTIDSPTLDRLPPSDLPAATRSPKVTFDSGEGAAGVGAVAALIPNCEDVTTSPNVTRKSPLEESAPSRFFAGELTPLS